MLEPVLLSWISTADGSESSVSSWSWRVSLCESMRWDVAEALVRLDQVVWVHVVDCPDVYGAAVLLMRTKN